MQGAPDSKAAVLPNAVHKDGVELPPPLFDPRHKVSGIPIAATTRPECMDREGSFMDPRIVRPVERGDFDFVTEAAESCGRLPD